MKNLIFLFLIFSFAVQGQESDTTNRYILGGFLSGSSNIMNTPESEVTNGGFTSTSLGSSSNTHSLNFSPYIGRIINQRSIVGARLSTGFFLRKFRFDDQAEDAFRRFTYTLGAGLFYRYYVNPNNKFKVFVQPSADFFVINGETEQNAPFLEEDRTINFSIATGLGLVYSISEKWNLLANVWSIGYSHSNFRTGSSSESETSNIFSANFSIRSINFGAEYSF